MQCSCGFQEKIGQKCRLNVFVSSFQTAVLVSYRRAKPEVWIRGQSFWDLRWKICHQDKFFSDYFGFPLSESYQPTIRTRFRLYATLSTRKKGEKEKRAKCGSFHKILFRKSGSVWLKKNIFSFSFFHSSKATLSFCCLLCSTRVRNFWTLSTKYDLPECTTPISERLCILTSSLV
jgi:hypothetical protein